MSGTTAQIIAEQGRLLFGRGRFDALLGLFESAPDNPAVASMAAAIHLRRGEAAAAEQAARSIADGDERRAKTATARMLPDLAAPLAREPRVHMLLLTHNRADMIPRAAAQLAATDYENYALFAADNGSDDDSFQALEKAAGLFPAHAAVSLERLPVNIGRPAGHNWLLTAHDHGDADYIAIVDDDLLDIPPTWLADMVRTARAFPNAAAVGGKAVNPGRLAVIHGGIRRLTEFTASGFTMSNEDETPDLGQWDHLDIVDHVIGCLHLYDARALRLTGLFDIRFSPCQLVDIEHHLRARLHGFVLVYNGLVGFTHAREMGATGVDTRPGLGNTLGNIVKLLHLFDPEQMRRLMDQTAREREAWLERWGSPRDRQPPGLPASSE